MFKNHLRIAIRTLLRHKSYTIINVAGLALGIACCLIVFMIGRHDLSFDW